MYHKARTRIDLRTVVCVLHVYESTLGRQQGAGLGNAFLPYSVGTVHQAEAILLEYLSFWVTGPGEHTLQALSELLENGAKQ